MSIESSQSQYVEVDEDLYVVQGIRDKRTVGGKIQYLVKWLKWDRPQDLTWEPPEHLATVSDMIEEFQKKYALSKGNKDSGATSKKVETKPVKKQLVKKKKISKQNNTKSSLTAKQSKQKSQIKKQQKNIEVLLSSSSVQQQNEAQQQSVKISSNNSKVTKDQQQIGGFNAIYIKDDGQIFYEVDVINKKQQIIGVKLIHTKDIKKKQKVMQMKYLENYLIDQDRFCKMF